MAVTSPNTVRAHAKGMGRRKVSLALFAGVAALPLLTMGITVPSAVAKNRAVSERDAMRDRLAERESIFRSLREYESDGALEELEELHRSLVGMIPRSIEHLDEFGSLRMAAAALDIELISVRTVRTHAVGAFTGAASNQGAPDQGATSDSVTSAQGTVFVDEVLIHLHESVDGVFGLVQELRKHGVPTLILSFDFTRETPVSRAFEAEVRLGFVRRAAPSSGGATSPR
ncbi:hypothetical protein Poly30_23730 [Planctomycetes bacterium Poly30]|uniref:Uncharacterized protein n=1 Tax=Saltatorellus ferox TaxID=2528018 RepID=A0A518ERZ4_9BACT|nr:hypothetical protein Poly30_23730 [Planctomycetes bacterium Poly30]